jgi:RND family efflux transporter MFP subunit
MVTAILLVGSLVAGCGGDTAATDRGTSGRAGPANGEDATQVEAYHVRPRSFEDFVEVTGTVEAIHDATLSAQVSGTVVRLEERGTRIASGGLIAQIDSVDARAAMEQAKAQYELAKDRFQRQEPLYRDSIISALEFQGVRSEVTQAKSALIQTKKRLNNTSITAPFSGTVEERFVERGEQISPGQEVARIVDVRPARIEAGIPERYVGEIEKGTPVEARFQSSAIGMVSGSVSFVGSTLDPDSRTFPIEVTLPNTEGMLKPEMVAQLRLRRSIVDNALVIPRVAVLRDEMGTDVYTLRRLSDSLGVAQNQPVKLGPQYGSRTVVSSGLNEDDRVIVVGQNNIAQGDTVNVVQLHDRLPGLDSEMGPAGSAPAN